MPFAAALSIQSNSKQALEEVCGAVQGPLFWDLPADNQAAVRIARSMGFAPVRLLKRMARGPAPLEQRRLIYALSGFETG